MYQIFRCRLPVGFNKHLHCHLFYRLRGQMLRCNLCNSKENKLRSVPNLPNFTRDQLTVAAIEFKLEFVKIRIAVWQQEIGVFFFFFFGGLLGDDLWLDGGIFLWRIWLSDFLHWTKDLTCISPPFYLSHEELSFHQQEFTMFAECHWRRHKSPWLQNA